MLRGKNFSSAIVVKYWKLNREWEISIRILRRPEWDIDWSEVTNFLKSKDINNHIILTNWKFYKGMAVKRSHYPLVMESILWNPRWNRGKNRFKTHNSSEWTTPSISRPTLEVTYTGRILVLLTGSGFCQVLWVTNTTTTTHQSAGNEPSTHALLLSISTQPTAWEWQTHTRDDNQRIPEFTVCTRRLYSSHLHW